MVSAFKQILNMSMTASVIIACVLAARLLLKRAPKIYSYALWSVVLFRLLCPVSFMSDLSVLELTSPRITESSGVSYVSYAPVERVLESGVRDRNAVSQTQEPAVPGKTAENSRHSPVEIGAWVWLTGMASMLTHSIFAWLRLRRELVEAVNWKGRLWLADRIGTPFVMGVLRPKVYLPSDTPMEERRYIVAHECHHIRRGDHIIKLLAYGALCVHWFNPLVWVAFILAGKDMEMSCDEAVIRKLGGHVRADYSRSLLRLATHKKIIAGTPLAFGEGDTKGRVRNMGNWKQPRVWVSAVCAAVCIGIVAVCAVNPEKEKSVADMTRRTNDGPTGCAYGDLHYTLPGGITHELRDAEGVVFEDGQENRNQYNPVWSLNGEVFGGIVDYILPEGTDTSDPSWPKVLELPEWEQRFMGHFGMGTPYDAWGLHFFTDAPPEVEAEQVDRMHYLFLSDYGNRVYDVWFDRSVVDSALEEEIISSAQVRSSNIYHRSLDYGESQSLGNFRLTVPGGYGYSRTGSELLEIHIPGQFGKVDTIVAGVAVRNIPNWSRKALREGDMVRWVNAIGVTWDEQRVSHHITDETEYGDHFLNLKDLHNGKTVFDINHHFYIQGNVVYDLWFDQLLMEEADIQSILDSVQMEELRVSEDPAYLMPPDAPEDEQKSGLEKCRAVVEAVQSGSCHLIQQRRYDSDTGSGDYQQEFLRHEDKWLSTITVKIAGTEERHANLYADGRYFSNMGKWNREELLWTEMKTKADPLIPWLAVFPWNEDVVTYMDTLHGSDMCTVMLRVDEPYIYSDDSGEDHYFVNFFFDPDGKFINAQIQVNLFREDAFELAESIVSLDPNAVAAAIDTEYRRATGKAAVQGTAVTTETLLYQKTFSNSNETVDIQIDTLLVLPELEKHGLTVEKLQEAVEQELRRKTVDDYGLNTAEMGYEDAGCEIRITDIKSGSDYLIRADEAVPTLEVWGTRIYLFANGDRLGQEQDSIKLLLLNARDGTILISFGEKG